MDIEEVKIEIYVPIDYVTRLRDALNDVGACRVGNYDHCVSVSTASGYWRPLEDACPYDGTVGEISHGQECKMEVRCKREFVKEAVRTIRALHPYEEPVINIIPLLNSFFDER